MPAELADAPVPVSGISREDIRRMIDDRICPSHVIGDVDWCDDQGEFRAFVASSAGELLLMGFKITLRGHRHAVPA